jgi:hypothetical protein
VDLAGSAGEELVEPQLQSIRVGSLRPAYGLDEWSPVHLLQTVTEHRTVLLAKEPLVDVHDEIGRDAKEPAVIGRMVDLAEAQPVRDDGSPFSAESSMMCAASRSSG